MVLRIVFCLCVSVSINSFLVLPITNAYNLSSYVRSNVTRIRRQSNCDGFVCTSSNECISESQKCDGIVDCRDGSDEFRNCRNINAGCVLPKKPVNGNWFFPLNKNLNLRPGEVVDAGTIVQFHCHPGYKLNEQSALTACLQQGWNKEPPSCVKVCPTLTSDDNTKVFCFNRVGAEIKCSEAVDGCYARFECAPYYESSDHRIRRYCVGGTWNLFPPQCLPVCGERRVSAGLLAVNATDVVRGDYPWVTALYERDTDSDQFLFICGGTMLTQKIILSAAHCVTNLYGDTLPSSGFRIAVGKYYKDYGDSRDVEAQYAEIRSILVHPKYRGDSRRHASDIALLITKDKLTFSRIVQPVCYRNLDSISLLPNEMGTVAGWGYTTASGSPSDTLQEITVPYKDDATCARELTSDWTDKYLTYDKFCAGYYNKSIAVCQGDSGSGLVFKNRNNRYYIHGVVSLTKETNSSCDVQVSGLYTRVSIHYEWLESVIAVHSVQSTKECLPDDQSDQCKNSSGSCVLPDNPNNGKWSIVTNSTLLLNPGEKVVASTLLKFECNSGYELSEENAYLICLKGGWNKKPPSCTGICPSLHSDNTTKVSCFDENDKSVNCSKATDGSYVKYDCAPYYEHSERRSIRYCVKRRWTLTPAKCVPVCGGKKQFFPTRIVNGKQIERWNYPWLAGITEKDPEARNLHEIICVGIILSQKVIVSVAHCVTNAYGDLNDINGYKIVVAKYSSEYRDPSDTEAQYFDVDSIKIPSNFRGDSRRYAADIAVLIPKDKLVFSKFVQPVCYSNVKTIKLVPNELGILAGWSVNGDGNGLKEETLPYIDDDTCNRECPSNWINKYFTYDKMCAGNTNETRLICLGGSGSPLVFKNNDRYYLHGVYSLGKRSDKNFDDNSCSCALFTKISTHYDWLTSIIDENS